MVMGSSQKRKLSMPLGLSATAKKLAAGSFYTVHDNELAVPFHFMAPALKTASIMMRSQDRDCPSLIDRNAIPVECALR